MSKLLMIVVLAVPALAKRVASDGAAKLAFPMSVYHKIADTAAFNFPVDASILRQHIHPALSVDLDANKQAWVTILAEKLEKTSVSHLPVPGQSFEIQVRTMVTGPDPKTKDTHKGYWVFDLLVTDPGVVFGASLLFSKSIRVAHGNINVTANQPSYNLAGHDLEVTDTGKASVSVSATIMPSTANIDGEWFLNREASYGQNKDGHLTISMIHRQRFEKDVSTLPQMHVSDFSSTIFKVLNLGDDFGKEVFAQHPEGAFFVGGYEATFKNSVTVNPHTSLTDEYWRQSMIANR